MRTVFKTVAVIALVFISGVLVARQRSNPVSEQKLFLEEKPLQNPAALSPGVLNALLRTKQARLGLQFATDVEEKNPAQLFRGAEVHLGGPDEVDLVVIGIPPMTGADNGWFWVVRPHNHPKVVLFAGGNSLEIMDSRTNGLRDIRSDWSSPNETRHTVYHFDGKAYKIWKEKWIPIPVP